MRIAILSRALVLSILGGSFITSVILRTQALSIDGSPERRALAGIVVSSDDIGGVVRSSKGPEAGVWVIAETTDLPTKFRKIVVSDEGGRYLLPELPKANYKVWVRGYGLVDSKPAEATPGQTLALTAVVAPDARAAAQYYPGDYWLSLLKVPPKSAFPMKVREQGAEVEQVPEGAALPGIGNSGGNLGLLMGTEISTQAQWLYLLKRGCEVCHQVGNKATREIEPELGVFDSPSLAWERRLMTGQVGPQMMGRLNNFGHDRGLAMFADWSSRIAAGEVPPAPPRPQGIERNVVISMWDFGTDKSFFHDVISTDERNPTVNAYGPIYGLDFSAGAIAILDPVKNTRSTMISVPLVSESDRKLLRTHSLQRVAAPSPYWGNQIVWNDPVTVISPQMDGKGRIWFYTQTRVGLANYCKADADNPFAKNFPMPIGSQPQGPANYDPKTGRFEGIDACMTGGHGRFANDIDQTLYASNNGLVGGLGFTGSPVALTLQLFRMNKCAATNVNCPHPASGQLLMAQLVAVNLMNQMYILAKGWKLCKNT